MFPVVAATWLATSFTFIDVKNDVPSSTSEISASVYELAFDSAVPAAPAAS